MCDSLIKNKVAIKLNDTIDRISETSHEAMIVDYTNARR